MAYVIGIDCGTGSTKTVLFDENGNVISSASAEYPLYQPKTVMQNKTLLTGKMLCWIL